MVSDLKASPVSITRPAVEIFRNMYPPTCACTTTLLAFQDKEANYFTNRTKSNKDCFPLFQLPNLFTTLHILNHCRNKLLTASKMFISTDVAEINLQILLCNLKPEKSGKQRIEEFKLESEFRTKTKTQHLHHEGGYPSLVCRKLVYIWVVILIIQCPIKLREHMHILQYMT